MIILKLLDIASCLAIYYVAVPTNYLLIYALRCRTTESRISLTGCSEAEHRDRESTRKPRICGF